MRNVSIRARLLILISLIFTSIMVVAGYRANERREADTRYMFDRLQAQAMLIAQQQRDAIRHVQSFLDFYLSMQDPSKLLSDADCTRKLTNIVKHDGHFANVFIADLKGNVFCNPMPNAKSNNIADRSYFKQALQSDRTVVGQPTIGRFTQRWVLPVARRINDKNGQPIGVIGAGFDLDWVNQAFQEIYVYPDTRMGLVYQDGTIIARYPEPEKWLGKNISTFPAFKRLIKMGGEGTAEETSHDGVSRVYTFTRFAETIEGPIYLWLTVPKSYTTDTANAQFYQAVGLSIGLCALFFSLAWFGAKRWLVKPLEKIIGAAQQISTGNFEAKTGLPHTTDEIGMLATSFDSMVEQLSRYDVLTGLLNLRSFEEALDQEIEQAKENGQSVTVLQLRIKNFHHIESSFGRDTSRDLLKLVANRLQTALVNWGIVARLSESNFVMAIPERFESQQVIQLIDHFRNVLCNDKIEIGNSSMVISALFGISLYPNDGMTSSELVQHAGVALDHAAESGQTGFRFYSADMNLRLQKQLAMASDIRQSIINEDFELYYQPQIDIRSERVIGLEALVRWHHPREGFISPAHFIPLAEETGLIVPLGSWILLKALTQYKQWQEAESAMHGIVIAVNTSAIQLASAEFIKQLEDSLSISGVTPASLELELTESQLMNFVDEDNNILHRLKDFGVQLSIDDFGTGYSSLSYLKNFKVDKLKIDKSFIDHITHDANDAAIVQATIAMGQSLGVTIIAEGVETAEQIALLKSLSCEQVQGYYYSRPLPAAQVLPFIQQMNQKS